MANWRGTFGGDTVSVLLGNGDGTFAPQVQYDTGEGPFGIIAADVNADGCTDLVATKSVKRCQHGFRSARQLRQNVSRSSRFFYGVGATFVAAGHSSSGRKPDLAVTNFNQKSVSILLGNILARITHKDITFVAAAGGGNGASTKAIEALSKALQK